MKLPWKSHPQLFHHQAHLEGVLGTSLEIQTVATDPDSGPKAVQSALEVIDKLESIFSVYRPDSEFMVWQRTRGEEIAVSNHLAVVLDTAEKFRRLSKNAFCPVADSLAKAWQEDKELPEMETENPLWSVDIDRSIAIRHTSLPATLNAIAKGYIVDQAAIALSSSPGIQEALINIGGDLKHVGKKGIEVAIADPNSDAENFPPIAKVKIANEAVTTSGGYRRGFGKDGQRYSHIFNTLQGRPSEVASSATAIAPSAMESDIISTIINVLPMEEALSFADSMNNVAVFIVSHDERRGFNSLWSSHICQ